MFMKKYVKGDLKMIGHSEMLQLKRWNTPTIYNGWEQITSHDITKNFNREPIIDFMEYMGPMVGRAITVIIEPSKKEHQEQNRNAWTEYREYVASIKGPKIVVVQDLDKPETVGAFWGEVNSNCHKALGCVGTITDGAIRDVDEMRNAGFKAMAKRFCVGHAYSVPVRWGCSVEVFGTIVNPCQLIHADKHGFIVIPEEDEDGLLEATTYMDCNECSSIIPASRSTFGLGSHQIITSLADAGKNFDEKAKLHFGKKGEW